MDTLPNVDLNPIADVGISPQNFLTFSFNVFATLPVPN